MNITYCKISWKYLGYSWHASNICPLFRVLVSSVSMVIFVLRLLSLFAYAGITKGGIMGCVSTTWIPNIQNLKPLMCPALCTCQYAQMQIKALQTASNGSEPVWWWMLIILFSTLGHWNEKSEHTASIKYLVATCFPELNIRQLHYWLNW